MKTNYDRQQIINAIRRFDESSQGDVYDNISNEDLFKKLEIVADELGGDYTADELITAAEEGF